MNKEQLQSQIDDIDEAVLAYTLATELIQAQILALLQQKEQLVHERNKLKKERNPVGFKT